MSNLPNTDQFRNIFKHSLRIDARTISIKTLLSDRNLKRIDYTPYYQRNYVWDSVKQSFFIESVILGTEIPPLIFFKSGLKIEVIDGRQRFETLKRFKENNITLTTKGLFTLQSLDRQSFNKLDPPSLKDVFLESNIRVFEFEIINEPNLDPILEDQIKKEIFRRYNTGITPLTNFEVDKARYSSDSLTELMERELEDNQKFRKMVVDCFYESQNVETAEVINYLRKLFIIHKFPISRYASSNNKNETIQLLYEFSTQEITDVNKQFLQLKETIEEVSQIYSQWSNNSPSLRSKFLYECLFWTLRILKTEEAIYDLQQIINESHNDFAMNAELYTRDDYHYYSKVVSRFQKTAEIVSKFTNLDFNIFIRNNQFKKSLNEKINRDKKVQPKLNELEHLRINKPAPISTPIDEIRQELKTHKYQVRPSYQREERINETKASSIIESILLGINLPPIFVLKREDGVKEVIDGQQRLLSILGYIGEQYIDEKGNLQYSKNNFFKLKGLKILTELNGANYHSLSNVEKDKLLDFTLDIIIIEERLNPQFEATDLFIRLNYKPYPIFPNSFEMWNATVDREIIEMIKYVAAENGSWFYSKETQIDALGRRDRMENEELVTILSFIVYHVRQKSQDKLIGFYPRLDRITCRLKSKSALSDFLMNMNRIASEKQLFIEAINHTERLIRLLKTIFGNTPSKDSLNSIFNVKKTPTYRRSFQDFYILWLMLSSYDDIKLDNLNLSFTDELTSILKLLKNEDSQTVNEEYVSNFFDSIKSYYP